MTAARNDQLTTEYGKAIVFDYSYRYFHGDGYGKDFHILNQPYDRSTYFAMVEKLTRELRLR